MDNTDQVHNLYGDVAVLSVRDRIGVYIDQELETFRSQDGTADSCIRVSPLASLDGKLRQISELRGIQYYVHVPMHERYAGYQGAYWRFDELGDSLMHVFYSPQASLGWVWTIVEQWIKVVFLQRGWMAVHSCAFVYQDVPVVVVGWQGLGKSVLLHHALAEGAAYVSDDFTLVSSSGEVRGYPPAVVDAHDRILGQHTMTAEQRSRYHVYSGVAKLMRAIAARPVLGRVVKAVARQMGYNGTSVRRIRMDELQPGLKVVLRSSAALWVILLPVTNGSKERPANMPLSEAAERVVAATMTDYYFAGQYDRFLYQAGQRALNDHLILNAREMYRDILLSALEQARDIWAVDASTVLSNPGRLLALIQDFDLRAVDSAR